MPGFPDSDSQVARGKEGVYLHLSTSHPTVDQSGPE